jgi:hypothetical protein
LQIKTEKKCWRNKLLGIKAYGFSRQKRDYKEIQIMRGGVEEGVRVRGGVRDIQYNTNTRKGLGSSNPFAPQKVEYGGDRG